MNLSLNLFSLLVMAGIGLGAGTHFAYLTAEAFKARKTPLTAIRALLAAFSFGIAAMTAVIASQVQAEWGASELWVYLGAVIAGVLVGDRLAKTVGPNTSRFFDGGDES